MSRAAARELGLLRELDERDPTELRKRLLRVVADLADGDGAVVWTLKQEAGRTVVATTDSLGATGSELYFNKMRTLAWPNELVDPARPRRGTQNRFVAAEMTGFVRVIEQSPLADGLWRPLRIRDQLRVYLYDGDQFVGTLASGRTIGTKPFTRRDAMRIQPAVAALRAALVATEMANLSGHAHLVVSRTGRVELASDAARTWLEVPGAADRVRAFVRGIERGTHAGAQLPGASWARVHGSRGHAYSIQLVPFEPVRLAPDRALSPAQRRVAECLVDGATIDETARSLGAASETVRAHRKEIYRRLDVGSRLELARALRR